MTTILSIETSTEIASVSILSLDHMFYKTLEGVQTHSQGILPAVQELLMEANLKLNQCDAIGYGCGPGAFTGVRTACGIVQGLAFGLDIPVIPICSLLAMAHGAKLTEVDSVSNCDISQVIDFICVLDARMGEVYWAHYRIFEGNCEQISAPQLSIVDEVLQYAKNEKFNVIVGSGVDQSLFHEQRDVKLVMPHAKDIAKLSLNNFQNGHFIKAEFAQPLYLRNKIALTSIERAQEKIIRNVK